MIDGDADLRRGTPPVTVVSRTIIATVCLGLVCGVATLRAQEPAAPAAAATPVVRQAEAASAAGDAVRAASLYRQALGIDPAWAEGWWRLGLLLYDADAYADAAAAFARSTTLAPSIGTTWVMRGLSEFHAGRHDDALTHIQHGRRLGVSQDPQFRHVMLYHEGLLLAGKAEFERAQETLAVLAAEGVESEEVTVAAGLAALRMRPDEIGRATGATRDAVLLAGRAELLAARKQHAEALAAYERLTRTYSSRPNVHYALGRFHAARQEPEEAVAAFRRELENSPQHVPARLSIAAILRETDPAAALPYAEAAVTLNPRVPLGRFLLGSLLLQTGQVERAIVELEAAERSVTEDPAVYYALARAYVRAGRDADAARARARFEELTEAQQRAARRDRETPP